MNRHNFTDEQRDQCIAAYAAWMRGEEYEYFDNFEKAWSTATGGSPDWNVDILRRPIPTPKVIPFTRDTLPALPFEVRDTEGNRCSITGGYSTYVVVEGSMKGYKYLLKTFTFPSGKPCGQEVIG